MVQLTPTKIITLTTLAITLLLSIISMAALFQPGSVWRNQDIARAFSVVGFLLILGALVIYLILFFTCSDNAKILIIVVIVLGALCLISEAIALGVLRTTALFPNEWLMATVWMSIPVIIGGILILLMDDEGF